MAVLAIVLPCKKHYVRSRKYLISQLGKVPIFKWILVIIYLFHKDFEELLVLYGDKIQ